SPGRRADSRELPGRARRGHTVESAGFHAVGVLTAGGFRDRLRMRGGRLRIGDGRPVRREHRTIRRSPRVIGYAPHRRPSTDRLCPGGYHAGPVSCAGSELFHLGSGRSGFSQRLRSVINPVFKITPAEVSRASKRPYLDHAFGEEATRAWTPSLLERTRLSMSLSEWP